MKINPIDIVGRKFQNNDGYSYLILKYTGMNLHRQHTYTIQFEKSHTIRSNVTRPNIFKGSVKDYYSATVAGVGFLGNARKSEHKKEYNIWADMLARCYKKNASGYRWYGELGVSVCDRWLCFENFVKDLPLVAGYDEILFKAGSLRLDKDILKASTYSLNTCVFVSHKENMAEAFKRYNENKSRKIVVFPDGHIETITNLTSFCKKHGISYRNVYYKLNGNPNVDLNGFDFFYDKSVTTIQKRKRNRSRAE